MSQGPSAPSQWSVPPAFDGYRVVMTLGEGPRSQVCLGHDTVLDRPVIIRFLNLAASDNATRDHFFAEARAAARVQHPNVMTVYRVGEVGGRAYLISEYVQGQLLSTLNKPLSARSALHCALGMARGLAAAHRRGILHRDLKPSNVVLSDEGEVKLLDFGLVDFLDPGAVAVPRSAISNPSRQEAAISSPASPPVLANPPAAAAEVYRAPECRRGPPNPAGDVYSLGVVLYELCCGSLPSQHSDESQRTLGERFPELDPRFATIIDRCMATDVSERPASGSEVLDALELLAPWAAADTLPEGNPYRGLLPFEAEHRGLFFGRRAEIGTLMDRLRTEAAILVAAESGIGKSSLCRAGILPLVAEGALGGSRRWRVASMVPGRHPLRALVNALRTTVGFEEAPLETLLRTDPGGLARELAQRLGNNLALVLFVDQLEELVTIAVPDESRLVSEALGSLLTRTSNVRVLLTARSDFLGRIAMLEGLGTAVTACLYILRPLGPERIRDVIVGPAHAKGVVFENPDVVNSLIETTAQTDGGLPLLQFALSELWEAREGNQISAAALEAIGGVAGALARHADLVIAGLSSEQRVRARRVLMALVTLEGTRARRTEEELGGSRSSVREVLEVLVKGRLLVARDTAEGPAYEVAHEALIKGWGTLRTWLEEYAESRAVRQRLEQATAEWRRLGRSREALWGARQITETEILDPAEIGPREREFLSAGRRQQRQRQHLRSALFITVPLILAISYGVARYAVRRDVQGRVNQAITQGLSELQAARAKTSETDRLRGASFAAFDGGKGPEGEKLWGQARATALEADRSFGRASQLFEAALAADYSNERAHDLLADTLYERALGAERDRNPQQLEDLLQRLSVYDLSGTRRTRWSAPGSVSLNVQPATAHVLLGRYERGPQLKRHLTGLRELDARSRERLLLPAGSYLLVISAPGAAEVNLPFQVTRSQELKLEVTLPSKAQVPSGFVYVPAGTFLFGSPDESMRRSFFTTAPLHESRTDAFLIARHETTYGDWLAYLSALPADRRAALLARSPKGNLSGSLQLKQLANGSYQIILQPITQETSAEQGKPLIISARKQRVAQDWLKLPAGGISFEDALAYVAWLRETGRVPGARLCDEFEWERAGRGADDREYPHGDQLDPGDANFDATYDKDNAALGPDEVGSYPGSRSPFGIDDMAGNIYEWVQARLNPDEVVARSGGYYATEITHHVNNRNVYDRQFRDPGIGVRVCATWPPQGK